MIDVFVLEPSYVKTGEYTHVILFDGAECDLDSVETQFLRRNGQHELPIRKLGETNQVITPPSKTTTFPRSFRLKFEGHPVVISTGNRNIE